MNRRSQLTAKERAFLSHYLSGLSVRQSIVAANYSLKNASTIEKRLLRNPLISFEIEKHMEFQKYKYENAMSELRDGMTIAKETADASAYIEAIRIRATLSGLLSRTE